MKNFKKIIAAAMAATLACSIVMTGCNSGSGSTSSKTDSKTDAPAGDMQIELVSKGFQHAFWQAVKKGADEAAAELGVKINFVGPANETATEEQLQMLNNAINKKPAAIGLAALDTNAMLDAIKTAMDQNIPIIGFDSGVPGAPEGAILANASTDNKAGGALAAEELYKLIKDQIDGSKTVRIGVCSQELSSESIKGRTTGFIDKLIELIDADGKVKKDQIAVIGHDVVKNDVAEGSAKVVIDVAVPPTVTDEAITQAAQALLNKGDLIAAYGSNEMGVKGLLNADGTLNVLGSKVTCVGFDSGKLQLDAIKSGKIAGSVTQDPVNIGRKTVELCVKAAKGEEVSDVDTGCKFYTKDNMEDADIAPCLYE